MCSVPTRIAGSAWAWADRVAVAGVSINSIGGRWRLRSSASIISPAATAAATATRMLSLSGRANAAIAAVAATPVASQVARSNSKDSSTPKMAKTPAKPKPHDSGMVLANKMPATEGTCQASQFTLAAPQK